MWSHAQGNNLVLFTKCIKFWCRMTAMAIQNKQPMHPLHDVFCPFVEVLDPFEAQFVCRPAIITHSDSPIRRNSWIFAIQCLADCFWLIGSTLIKQSLRHSSNIDKERGKTASFHRINPANKNIFLRS